MKIQKTGTEPLRLEYKIEVFTSDTEDDVKSILTTLDDECADIAEQLLKQSCVLEVIISRGCDEEDFRKFCETHTWRR